MQFIDTIYYIQHTESLVHPLNQPHYNKRKLVLPLKNTVQTDCVCCEIHLF